MLSLTAGFSFSIGKVGWKRAVDTRPYERHNEWLTGYANTLSEQNRQYVGKLDKERRVLDELKKILEIEGLLDTYGHLFDDMDVDDRRFPRKQLQRAELTPCSVKESPLERQFAFYSLKWAQALHKTWRQTVSAKPVRTAFPECGTCQPIIQIPFLRPVISPSCSMETNV